MAQLLVAVRGEVVPLLLQLLGNQAVGRRTRRPKQTGLRTPGPVAICPHPSSLTQQATDQYQSPAKGLRTPVLRGKNKEFYYKLPN